jgi:hypothetical protein
MDEERRRHKRWYFYGWADLDSGFIML